MDKFAGVYETKKKDGSVYYRAGITYKGKHISLGSFNEAIKANTAYIEAGRILKGDGDPDSYKSVVLSFDKCITLMNFRDNNIYFKTPIYIRSSFFNYYYDKETVFTFDTDDLFYYASHKIMKRGGHLFVSDYGMQVNILSRYGIRNFGVSGKDYYFKNGDKNDLRYENVVCVNPYTGVRVINENGLVSYLSRIHVVGNYRIGIYKTAIEAAIAYNKAVDVLKKNGIDKNYAANYIEGLSGSRYAEIYSSVEISKRIYKISEKDLKKRS